MRRLWPFRHFGLKLMSVGLAVLLWLTVSGEETVERGLRVPLELQQFPAGLEIQGEAPSTVDVRVRGTSGALSRVAAGDVVAVLDLRAARAGNRLFPLTPELVHVPFGVEVVQIIPSTVALSFEPSVTREVPVVASTEGEPAPGYVLGKVTVTPDRVEIVGPESAVKRAREALTETISVADLRESQTAAVTIGLDRPGAAPQDAAQRVGARADPAGARGADGAKPSRSPAEPRPASLRAGDACRGRRGPSRQPRVAVTARCRCGDRVCRRRGPRSRRLRARRARRRLGSGRRDPHRSGNRARSASPVPKTERPPAPRLFGTDGVRGAAGQYPLDPPTVRRLGASLVRALPHTNGESAANAAPRLLVGRDTRESGGWIEAELAHGASGEGAVVTSAGVVPTPAIAYLTRSGYDAGIVISASHNPFEDNGIKVFSGRGEKFTESVERAVEAIVADPSWSAASGQADAVPQGQSADAYLDHLRAVFPESSSLARLHARHRLRERRHDAWWRPGSSRASASIPSSSANQPDGRNINRDCGSTHPELARADRRRTRLPHGRGIRRRRRPRDLRRPPRRGRQRRCRPADVCAPAAARRAAARQRDRGDRHEQHRPRDRVPRVGHQPGAMPCGRQVRDGGDDQGRRLARRRAVGPRDLLGLSVHGRRLVHRPQRAANHRPHRPYPGQPGVRSDQLPAGAPERARPRESRSRIPCPRWPRRFRPSKRASPPTAGRAAC